MRTAYLVGNGFDLSVGLDTSPGSFLQAFVDENVVGEAADDSTGAVAFAKDIESDGVETWADFETKIGEYSSRFSADQAGEYVARVAALRSFLGQWLQKQQSRADEAFIKGNAAGCIRSMTDYRSGLRPLKGAKLRQLRSKHKSENWYQDIVCFNYTDVLERMRAAAGGENTNIGNLEGSTCSAIGKFVYAHDSLKDKIVCGVNDASQIANEAFRDIRLVTDNLVKGDMEANVIANDLDAQARRTIDEANVVAVFGMSFGRSDRRWWEQVGKKLTEDKEVILVLFDYEMIDAEQGTEQIGLYQRNQDAMSTFASSAGIEMTSDVEDRIVVAPSNLLFPIKQPISANPE